MNSQKIKRLLDGLTTIKPPLNDEGNLDVTAFNQIPAVREVVNELKAGGVESFGDLTDKGFIAAALVLRFND